ncbi:MAG: quinolinate synthase NadA [Planctomycetaceae bacterium]|jgi:quinolinate synthase|nr:quinolinate synthase NadA [Planctomycetaceae bacterium]
MTISDHIESLRRKLGKSVLILGHHYQNISVVRYCDLVGDSFQLSAAASENDTCRTIVFCGVHFMAETADILANTLPKREKRRAANKDEYVPVVLPDLAAGCSMADMATLEQVQTCWDTLLMFCDPNDLVPVTYVNSSAALKAFCGKHGGLACTSTNAAAVLRWALDKRGGNAKILFFPDQHLGRNTALAMGIPSEQLALWSPDEPREQDEMQLKRSRVILWDGYCCVHQRFLPEHIDAVREAYKGIKVIVHPECKQDVVKKADAFGSTAKIIEMVTKSPKETKWAIGTETQLVERLAAENLDRTIINLSAAPSICATMALITPEKLYNSLEKIESGTPENVIRVEETTANDALLALERMLKCK